MKRLTTSDNAVKEFLFKDTSIEVVDEQARQEINDLAPVAKSGDYDDLENKPSLATVATTGSYNDLADKPSLATVATTGNYNDLIDKPSLATVATTGSYNDLNNKPSLAAVATTGSYNDLSDKPTIPIVNNATLTIQKNGTNVQTFTANASSNVTANITMTKSDVGLGNVGNFKAVSTVANQGLTDDEKGNARSNIGAGSSSFSGDYNDLSNKPALKTVATSGSYNDLTDKPTIPTVNNATLTIQKNGTNVQTFTANASSNVTANITMSKSDVGLGNVGNFKAVSTVASQGLTDTEKSNARANIGAGTSSFSGSYTDLTNKPTIPTVNNATLTIQKNGTNVQTFTANASANKTANITVPTKVSELTNDSGYTTNTGTVTQVKVGSTAYNPSSGVVSLPAYPTDTNTHRPIQVNGTEILGNNTTALNLKAGSNVSLSNSSGTVTIAATDTTYSSKAAASGGTAVSLVTTGEKYTWNNKQSALSRQTGTLTAGSGITLSNTRCEKYGKVVSVLAYCGGSVAANATLFTLPSGFRPPAKTYSISVATVSGELANPYVEVNTDGTVKALNAGSNYGVEMTFIIS